ncbi:MAG: hypothetical protein RLY31_2543 [Bacteroidota bacterium]|jgi:AraC-like DNA-binding protein
MKLEVEKIVPDGHRSFRLLTPQLRDRFYWHYHPEYELVYLEGADGVRRIGGHTAPFHGSDLAFIGPYIPHLNFDYGIEGSYRKVVVQLRADFLGAAFLDAPELSAVRRFFGRTEGAAIFHGRTKESVGAKLVSLAEEPPFRQLVLLLEILQELAQSEEVTALAEQPIASDSLFREEQRIMEVRHFVHTHYQGVVDIGTVSSLVHLTKPAFCRFFRKMTGQTFTEYLNSYRIQQARHLLQQGSSVTEACYRSGFGSLSYFNRRFRRQTGENPTACRRKMLRSG